MPNHVILRGVGRGIGPSSVSGTIIKALPDFPEDTPLLQLADGSAQAFGCCVMEVNIHCSGIPGSVGVYSAVAQERSGLRRVTDRITITVIQDGTGGWALTWNAVFKVSWSDTGNTAGKRSSISFVYDGTNWNQDGAQTPYV